MDNFLPPEEKSVFNEDANQLNEKAQQNFSQSSNQSHLPSSRMLEPTPNVSALGFAIVSLPFSLCRTWWFGVGWIWGLGTVTGIVLACLALSLANAGIQVVKTSPDVFSEKGLEKLKMARLLAIISLCICALSVALLVYYYTIYG
ncbi:MAG: hypothetical protein IAF38_18450 [Bacteroidia bacterium]|nr:hypothetical protein [Bacteroidia bacterium]